MEHKLRGTHTTDNIYTLDFCQFISGPQLNIEFIDTVKDSYAPYRFSFPRFMNFNEKKLYFASEKYKYRDCIICISDHLL